MVQNRNKWLFLWVQEMARNKVQFQKGLSEAQFAVLYGTEAQCREAVTRWRWPSGFVCPVCGGKQHSVIKTRALYQCTACRRQTSVIAGTIFAATKVPLCTWFRAMYHLTQSKGGISSIELGRRLGVTQTTALEDQAQTHAGDDGARRHKAPDGADRDRRRLSRRRAERRQAWSRFAWQDADRGCGRNHTGGQANPLEVAPRHWVPPCRNRDLGEAQFRSRQHRGQGRTALLHRRKQRRLRPSADHNRVRPQRRAEPRIQVGQYHPRQHQERHHWHLPRRPRQAYPPLPRRVRIPVQPPIRSRRHDATARLRRSPNLADAIPPPQIG